MHFKSFVEAVLQSGGHRESTISNSNHSEVHKLIRSWAGFFDKTHSILGQILPCIFIFDYSHSDLIYFSPSVLNLIGFENNTFLGVSGIMKFMDMVNPNDFKVYNEQIFPKDMSYIHDLSYEEAMAMTFSNNFRVKQANGLYKTLLMKKCFIVEPGTKLLYELGVLIDISSFKKELSITHTIEKFQKAGDYSASLNVLTEDYFPEMHANILSAREKEILTHLSMGTKRKDVGALLFISDNTVANHIKTILRKTNSQNMREAIAICKMNGII